MATGVYVTAQDIHNLKYKERQESLGGRTATQQFLKELQENDDAIVKTSFAAGTDAVECIFWTYRSCVDMWRNNYEVVAVDNTYETNRFDMPLTQFTGITGVHTMFAVGWALLKDETEASYEWAVRNLHGNFQS